MAKLIELDAVIDLDRPIDAIERLGATISGAKVRLVVKYQGALIICDSVNDAQELISEAAQRHSRWRFVAAHDRGRPVEPAASMDARLTDSETGKADGSAPDRSSTRETSEGR